MKEALIWRPDVFSNVGIFSDTNNEYDTSNASSPLQKSDPYPYDRQLEIQQASRISLTNLTAMRSKTTVVLRNVTLNIPIIQPGLVLIIGGNASGKTSLLLSILEELDTTVDSKINVTPPASSIAYIEHTPWIMNASVKQNILLAMARKSSFHSEFHNFSIEEEDPISMDLEEAVALCALESDLKEWEHGIETLIGERGVNISGGQRQRIALARALCSDAKIFLFDSPLSGLDAKVTQQVFHGAILEAAKSRMVVMTTHYAGFLPFAERIIALSNGEIVFDGSYQSYLDNAVVNADFLLNGDKDVTENLGKEEKGNEKGEKGKESEKGKGKAKGEKGNSIQTKKEDVTLVGTSFSTYKMYAQACGVHNLLIAILLTFLAYGISAFGDYLLAGTTEGYYTFRQYLIGYAVISFVVIIINLGRYFMYAYAGIIASVNLHDSLLRSILGATFSFFNETPSGRITSRFSSDLDVIDDSIHSSVQAIVDSLLGIITGIGVVCVEAPVYIFFAIPLTYLYLYFQRQYREVSKELKKIEAGAKSPLFSYFREVLCGLECVRGFRLQQKMIEQHNVMLDHSIRSRLNWDAANRWLGIRLDIIGCLIVSASAFSLLLARKNVNEPLPGESSDGGSGGGGGQAGLMLSYALKATFSLSYAIRATTALENMFISVDRVAEYVKLEQETTPDEPPLHISEDEFRNFVPPQSSSSAAANAMIEMTSTTKGSKKTTLFAKPSTTSDILLEGRNIVARYSPLLPPALRSISFTIPAGRIIGVCGRTGCGKSTLTVVLAGAMPLTEGQVLLRGQPQEDISLRAYRNNVQIFPQDSYIFSGPLRNFLDPHNSHTDLKLHSLLNELTKATVTQEFKDSDRGASSGGGGDTSDYKVLGLSFEVTSGGSNLSAGQKQVAVLARAGIYKFIFIKPFLLLFN